MGIGEAVRTYEVYRTCPYARGIRFIMTWDVNKAPFDVNLYMRACEREQKLRDMYERNHKKHKRNR